MTFRLQISVISPAMNPPIAKLPSIIELVRFIGSSLFCMPAIEPVPSSALWAYSLLERFSKKRIHPIRRSGEWMPTVAMLLARSTTVCRASRKHPSRSSNSYVTLTMARPDADHPVLECLPAGCKLKSRPIVLPHCPIHPPHKADTGTSHRAWDPRVICGTARAALNMTCEANARALPRASIKRC